MPAECLFSAPFAFLPEELRRGFQALMPTVFREVWDAAEVEVDARVSAWVVNPGQHFVVDERILEQVPSLQVIVTPSTGGDHIDEAACQRRGIAVYSLLDAREQLEGISASAEATFLLLLNALRRIDLARQEVAAGRWRSREDALRGHELSGRQVGIVGFGRIGQRLARYCTAFEAPVVYYDPYVRDPAYRAVPLEELFSTSDAVCLCCRLTPETRGMVSRRLLERLKPEACLVNTARGDLIVEEDLAAVLRTRPDLRVALDVLSGEVTNTHGRSPLLAFHERGQIVVTPHIAGATVESQTKAAFGALELLRRHVDAVAASGAPAHHQRGGRSG